MTIVFDFDGTLARSLPLSIDLFFELTGRTDRFSEEEVLRLRALPARQLVRELGLSPWRAAVLLVRGRRLMRARMADVPLVQGMAEVVSSLHADGHHLLIVSTNNVRTIVRFLDTHALRGYFSEIRTIRQSGKARVLRQLVRRQRARPDAVVYIGDDARDIEAARRAGVSIMAVGWGYAAPALLRQYRPDALVERPHELLGVLRSTARG